MDAGAPAPRQVQTQYGEVPRRTVRATSPQGMLPAGNVATSEPIVTAATPFLQPKGCGFGGNGPVMHWGHPAGIELYSWLPANRIKEMFSGINLTNFTHSTKNPALPA
jgi:hypothetical protein